MKALSLRLVNVVLALTMLLVPFAASVSAAPEPTLPAPEDPAASVLPAWAQLPAAAAQPATFHKVIARSGVLDASQEGITLWHDYGAFALYKVSVTTLNQLSSVTRSKIQVATDMDYIMLDAYPFNTQTDTFDAIPESLQVTQPDGPVLHLIQFVGPIKDAWLQAVKEAGATPIHYIANFGYLVWADDTARARLSDLARAKDFLQFSAPYQTYFKLGTSLNKRLTSTYDPEEVVKVTIQMYDHAGKDATEQLIAELLREQLSPWMDILDYQNVVAEVRAGDLMAIARQPDVFWIGEYFERELFDEVQDQILAANFNVGQTGPSGPGYLTWLAGHGLSTDPADYPVVDVTDDGIGNGTVNSGDYTLHEFGNIANPTRLQYVGNCTSAADGGGPDGHGHINTSIVGSYDTTTGFPYQDPNGFNRGLGVSPYARLAGTRVFDAGGFDLSACGNTYAGLIKYVQDNGAQIASNSWGCSGCAGTYDDSSQAFDVGVRDADLTEPGNQELIFVFAAGNSGPGAGTVGTPGNGKNMITVGASENDRPSDEDGPWTDGCGIGPTGADNAMDVIGFSSRGPVPGGRVKPEVIAPGTHIQGTASTHPAYNGSGVCDQYRPSGQTIFAASSGTSHSTPAVAGVSSLYYYWLQTHYGITPSPALMKAYLIAHPTYLTGVSANDTLPSNVQGYGMPNMALAFDDTFRYMVNQTEVFDNSGENWTFSANVVDPSKPVRVVMAYTDQAGAIGTSPEVNDLNLEVTAGGNTYLGNSFSGQWSVTGGSADNDNNYEAVFLPAGTSGQIDVTITAFNIAGDGVPNFGDATDQDFALVIYNVSLGPIGYLDGTVYDAGGTPATDPIIGASVQATGLVPTHTGSTTSGATGYYRMGLSTDTYTVTAVAYGYQMAEIGGVSVVSGTTTTLDIPLAPSAMYVVSGTVTDATAGWPLYARITIGGDPVDPPSPYDEVWTNPATGYYSVTLAEDVIYTFDVDAWVDGYNAGSRSVGPLTADATEDFALVADLAACAAPGYVLATPYSWDFEANDGGFAATNDWEWGTYSWAGTCSTSYPPAAPHSGTHMWGTVLNDCYNNLGATSILSFIVDLSSVGSATLSWWDWYDVFETFDHGEVYVNGDLVYDRAISYIIPTTWEQHEVDLSPYVGGAATIEFRMYATTVVERAGWYIDDVEILAGCNLQPGGLVVGNVYDDNTSDPVVGAEVANEDGYMATAAATPDDPAVDDAFYTLFSPHGTKTFTTTMTGYQADVLAVTVVQSDTVWQDFYLPSPHIEFAPPALSYTLELGSQITQTPGLVISNTGEGVLDFELQEQEGGFQPTLAMHALAVSTTILEGTTGPIAGWHPSDTPPEYPSGPDGTAFSIISPLSWGTGTPIPSGAQRMGASVTTDSKTFYLIGGYTGSYLDQNLHYDPATGTWDQSLASMPTARGNIFAYYNPDDGMIYVPGGYTGSYRNEFEAYDPASDSWTTLAPLPIAKSGANGGIVDGKLYLFGGSPAPQNETQIYDIASDTWSSGTPLPVANQYGANVTYEGYIYVIGGWQSAILYRYDPATDTWQAGPSLNTARNSPAAAVSSDGVIYVWGGGADWTALYDGEYYDLAGWPGGSWTLITDDNLPQSNVRAGHACASDLLWNEGGGSPSHDGNQYWDGLECYCPDAGVPWFTEDPITGTVAPGDSLGIDIGWWADVPEVDQPGNYYASLKIKSNDLANQDLVLPVTMTVTPPSTWGKLEGTVTGLGYCDADPAPLEGAGVLVESWMTETVSVTITLLDEDFEGAFPPAGWQVFDNAGAGNIWDRNDALGAVNRCAFGSGHSAAADSDAVCNGLGWDTELWSPPLDLTGATAPELTYASNFQDYAGDGEIWLDVSTDGGATWTNLRYQTTDDPSGGTLETEDLSAHVGNVILLRWRYSDNNDGCAWYWHIDDVLVTGLGEAEAPVHWPLETDENGYYHLWMEEAHSPLTVTVTYSDHETGLATGVNVIGQVTTTVDFDLRWLVPCVSVDPLSMEATVLRGTSETQTLTLFNDGAVSTLFGIREQEGTVWPPSLGLNIPAYAGTPRERLPGYDPNATTTEGQLAPSANPPAPRGILAAGDVLAQWPSGLALPWGTGFGFDEDTVWLSNPAAGGGDDLDHEFETDGTPTGRTVYALFDAGDWGGDIAYNPNTGMFWQVNVGGDNCIYEWNPTTGQTGNSICDPAWTWTSQRGLAYDPTDDTFFIGGWNDTNVYHTDNTGAVIEQWPLGLSVSGLAYNFEAGLLFIIENSATDSISVLDVASGTIVDTFTVAGFGGHAGTGLAIDCDGNLWAANQNDANAYLIDSGVPADLCGVDVPWLSEDPITGTAGADSTFPVEVTFTALPTMTTGIYTATLVANTDDPVNPRINVPVTMTVVAAPICGFISSSPDDLGETTYFTNTTDTGYAPTTYRWGFGDDSAISAAEHPTHTYGHVGLYTVVLTATNLYGENVCSGTVSVEGVEGDFVSNSPVSLGDPVVFTNTTLSNPPIVRYFWTFGDSESSEDENPVHTYAAPGIYTVTLFAANVLYGPDNVYDIYQDTVEVLAPPYGVSIAPMTASAHGVSAVPVFYTLQVDNTGSLAETFGVTVNDNIWTTTVPATIGPIAAGGSANLVVTVTIPATALFGATDTASVTVASQGNPAQSATATLTTTSNNTYGVMAALSTNARSGEPGASVTYTLQVTNTGNTVDTLTMAVSGNGWTTDVPDSIGPLASGEGRDVQVVVNIPAGANDGEDDTVTITATSQNDGTKSDTIVLTTTAAVACVDVSGADFTFAPVAPLVGQTVTFTGTVITGTPPITYTWDFGDDSTLLTTGGESGSGQVVTHTYAVSDTYTVVMTATNACPSQDTASHAVVVTGEPDIEVIPLALIVTLNPGSTATRTLTVSNVGTASLTWNLAESPVRDWLDESPMGGTIATSDSNDVLVVLDATGLSDGVYTTTLQVTSDDPDEPQVDVSVVLTVTTACVDVSGADFTFAPVAPQVGETVTFTGTVMQGTPPITYTWAFGDGEFGSGQVVTHTYAVSDAYNVVMTATNAYPSQDTATHAITIVQSRYVYLPIVIRNYSSRR